MPNYYTQFSTRLKVGSPENVTKAIALLDQAEENGFFNEDGHHLFCEDGGFIARADEEPGWLALYEEEQGVPENLAKFVLLLAKEFDLQGLWGFTWSQTCARPVVDAFTGGAILLDLGKREQVEEIEASSWLADKLKETKNG